MQEHESDSLDGRNWRCFALTVEEQCWHLPEPAHTSSVARDSGGVSSQTQRHQPSRMSRSRLRTARNTCAVTGWSGWHSIIHCRLAHNQQPIYYLFLKLLDMLSSFLMLKINNSKFESCKCNDESTIRSSWRY